MSSRLEALQTVLESFHLGKNPARKAISELLEELLLINDILKPS